VAVLAHDEVGVQADLRTGRRQAVEGAHRHVDFVADAVDVDEDLGRGFFQQGAGEAADHRKASGR